MNIYFVNFSCNYRPHARVVRVKTVAPAFQTTKRKNIIVLALQDTRVIIARQVNNVIFLSFSLCYAHRMIRHGLPCPLKEFSFLIKPKVLFDFSETQKFDSYFLKNIFNCT